jgi:predicted nucleotidyltransferase
MVNRENYYELVERIRDCCIETFGDNTLSVILYGSVATEDFIPDPTWTDIDFIVVLKAMTEEQSEREEKNWMRSRLK